MNFPSVCIAGPGLLGGSLLLALRERVSGVRLNAWARSEESLRDVRERALADETFMEIGAAVAEADLVVLCVPVEAMPELARQMKRTLRPDAVVTDVGSVKGSVVAALEPILGAQFLGAHPMAGSDQSGSQAARADLFAGAKCMLTPTAATSPAALETGERFWQAVGCRTAILSPAEHDEVVALISHLPHVLAAALVDFVASQHAGAFDFCGPGFRDTSRVAGGEAAMWTGILQANAEPVRKSVQGMIAKLQEVEKLLARPESLRAFLEAARRQRQCLNQNL